jgi:hypothetical protein
MRIDLSQSPNAMAPPPSLEIKDDIAEVSGYQRFQATKTTLTRMALPGSLQRSAQQRTSQAWLRLFL